MLTVMSTAMPTISIVVSIPLGKPMAVSVIPTAISKRKTYNAFSSI